MINERNRLNKEYEDNLSSLNAEKENIKHKSKLT